MPTVGKVLGVMTSFFFFLRGAEYKINNGTYRNGIDALVARWCKAVER